jgi:acyl-CoA hydrolase
VTTTQYWADNYIERRKKADESMRKIRPGQRVFIGSACGTPQELVRTLSEAANRMTGLEIVRMMSQETTPLTSVADRTKDLNLNIRNIYLGSARIEPMASNKRFITPMNMSDVPNLFKTKKCRSMWP